MRTNCKFRQTSIALALAVNLVLGCQTTRTEVVDRPVASEGFAGLMRPTHHKTVNIQMALARSLEGQGDLAGAQAAYQEVIRLTPKSAEAHHRLAIVYDRQGKHEKAEQMYQAALKLQPGNAEIFSDIGYSQYAQRRWAEAERSLRQAIAINGDHNRAHNNLALVLAHNERYKEALAEFRKGGATSAESQLNVSFVMAMNGHLEEARSACQLALNADPSLGAARTRLTELDSVIAKTTVTAKQEAVSSQIKLTELKKQEQVTADLPTARNRSAALEGTPKAVDAKHAYSAPTVAGSTSGQDTISKGGKAVVADFAVIPASTFEPPIFRKQDTIADLGGTSSKHTPPVWNLTPGFDPSRKPVVAPSSQVPSAANPAGQHNTANDQKNWNWQAQSSAAVSSPRRVSVKPRVAADVHKSKKNARPTSKQTKEPEWKSMEASHARPGDSLLNLPRPVVPQSVSQRFALAG